MRLKRSWQGVVVGLLLSLALALPAPARADGGPILDDPELWALLEEGMQIAVVRLDAEEDTAQVDLFVSLLDASGESHEITFFIPLGSHPTGFDVIEENSFDFELAQTEELDGHLADAAEWEEAYRSVVRFSLMPGALLIVPLSWPCSCVGFVSLFMMGAPLAEQGPVATFQTEHSVVELYDIDADTRLEGLIATTGLDPAVQETLHRFEGQQIAVVTMQTQPTAAAGEESRGYRGISGQQGLHLAWAAHLVPGDEGPTYAYPLGTGSAWARPIELTRVYVVAPPGVDFRVAYPRLGEDHSGYVAGGFYGRPEPRIMRYTSTPGYAVDQAVGDFGRVWRATYVQSNAAEDVVVTRVEDLLPETRAALRRPVVQQWVMRLTWAVGLLAAFAIWVIVWRFVMSRRLGLQYRWADLKLWKHAIGWALVYPVSNVVALIAPAVLTIYPILLGQLTAGLGEAVRTVLGIAVGIVALVLLALTSPGIVSGFLFAWSVRRSMGIPWGRAAGAYALVVIASSVGYGLFALAYLALVGGLW